MIDRISRLDLTRGSAERVTVNEMPRRGCNRPGPDTRRNP